MPARNAEKTSTASSSGAAAWRSTSGLAQNKMADSNELIVTRNSHPVQNCRVSRPPDEAGGTGR